MTAIIAAVVLIGGSEVAVSVSCGSTAPKSVMVLSLVSDGVRLELAAATGVPAVTTNEVLLARIPCGISAFGLMKARLVAIAAAVLEIAATPDVLIMASSEIVRGVSWNRSAFILTVGILLAFNIVMFEIAGAAGVSVAMDIDVMARVP